MSSILYHDYQFPSGFGCQVCDTCAVGRIPAKQQYDRFRFAIDWTDLASKTDGFDFCPTSDNILSVETVVYRVGCGEEETTVDICDVSADVMGTSPTRQKDRRTLQGPITRLRIGGAGCGHYRVGVHVVYGQGCECYDWSGVWDLEIVEQC